MVFLRYVHWVIRHISMMSAGNGIRSDHMVIKAIPRRSKTFELLLKKKKKKIHKKYAKTVNTLKHSKPRL